MAELSDGRVADYFVHCGLPAELEELNTPLEDFPVKVSHNFAPITDVTVIFPEEEAVPSGYKCIEKTPTGLSADLNHGSLRSKEVFLCYKRGWDRPPLADIGVLYDGKEYVMADSQVVEFTPGGRVANVNNSSARTYITYRRAEASAPCNELVVTDICVIVLTKDEVPPHTYCIIPKTLNKGMVGSDVYICYKKSMRQPTRIVYKPGMISRYPVEDRPNFPLPPPVPRFCLPMGATIELWPSQAVTPTPVFSTFVFTVADGAEKVYGSSITFYERYRCSDLSTQQRLQLGVDTHHPSEISLNTNRSIGLLSHWPFFDTFSRFLMFLHQLSVSGRSGSVPLERYISHFLLEVPFPSVARPRVHVQLTSSHVIDVCRLHSSPLPQSGAGFCQLLRNLGPDNCLLVLLYTLVEHKLLLHSLRPDTLTRVSETVHSMIFPFQWQCPYIPLCPLDLADILSAPVPFLVGLDSRYFDVYDPPQDVTCVDLDTNTIFVAKDKRHLITKMLPRKAAKVLRGRLEDVYHKLYPPSTNQRRGGEQSDVKQRLQHLELEIQEAFLRFMLNILRGYRSFLKPLKTRPQLGTTDPGSLFNMEGFLKSRDRNHHPFYQMLMRTQMFVRFIEERSFVSEKDTNLVFFDECLEKDSHSPEVCLLEVESGHSETTVFIPPPEPVEDSNFTYHEFGSLNSDLFLPHPSFLVAPSIVPAGATVDGKSHCVEPACSLLPGIVARNLSAPSHLATGVAVGATGTMYPSPMLRRTKHEVMSARKLAQKQLESPARWSQHLVNTCFSLWFVHLPCYLEVSGNDKHVMEEAFQMLVSAQKILHNNVDEVCYRVMMQLCGQLSLPVLAVRVMYRMKLLGVHPSAITYGYYNRAVLDGQWPSDCSTPGKVLWMRLRNVVKASSEFRSAQKRMERRRALAPDLGPSTLSIDCEASSTPSIGSLRSLVSARKVRAVRPSFCGAITWRARNDQIVSKPYTDRNFNSLHFETAAGDLISSSTSGSVCGAVSSSNIVSRQPTPARVVVEEHRVTSESLQERGGNQSDCLERTGASGDCSGQSESLKQPKSPANTPVHSASSPNSHQMANSSVQRDSSPNAHQGALMEAGVSVNVNANDNDKTSINSNSATNYDNTTNNRCVNEVKNSNIGAANGDINNTSSSNNRNTISERGTHHNDDDDCDGTSVPAALSNSVPNVSTSTARLQVVASSSSNISTNSGSDGSNVSGAGVGGGGLMRTPVTENDPLGLFGAAPGLAGSDPVIRSPKTDRNAIDVSVRVDGVDDMAMHTPQNHYPPLRGGSSTLPAGVAALKARRSLFDSEQFGGSAHSELKGSAKHHHKTKRFISHAFSMDGSRFSFKLDRASSLAGEHLRTAEKRFRKRLNTIQPDIDDLMKNYSPSSLKQHELVRSSVDTLRSAATSVYKKLDELKGAVSSQSPGLVKTRSLNSVDNDETSASMSTLPTDMLQANSDSCFDMDPDSLFNSKNVLNSLLPSFSGSSAETAVHQLPAEMCLSVTSCSRCTSCAAIVYDEQIMAGWTAEDSNLNSRCPYCRQNHVPLLTVEVSDLTSAPPSLFLPGNGNVTVPYLSPLVLRKEMENVIEHDGVGCMAREQFVVQHPIIFWNMVWYMRRICGPSHLASLYWRLHGKQTDRPSTDSSAADFSRVRVRCLWHNRQLQPQNIGRGDSCQSAVEADSAGSKLSEALLTDSLQLQRRWRCILLSVSLDQLQPAMLQLAAVRAIGSCRSVYKQTPSGSQLVVLSRTSLYWSLLLATLTEFGKENVSLVNFDRQYARALEAITCRANVGTFNVQDRAPRLAELHCRHTFSPLDV